MKKILCFVLTTFMMIVSKAQTFGEWFQQKEMGVKYLAEQIVALKAYASTVVQGYGVVKYGLDAISNSKGSDDEQQEKYITSLKRINPKIGSYSKIAAIIALQQNILKQYQGVKQLSHDKDLFTNHEAAFVGEVISNLLNDCSALMEQLILLTTDDKLSLKDGERLQRIDALYLEMQDCYWRTGMVSNQLKILARNKKA